MRRSPDPEVPEGFTIPRSLRSKLDARSSAWEAATEILKWVSTHVKLDEESGPQDAAAVLRRGSGRCSGMANTTAALMLAAGFEAHTISGLLVTDEGAVPHRWVVCRLPDAGWVPTDPTLGLWVVTPNHLTFSDTVRDLPHVEVVKHTEDDLDRLPRWRGVPARPNVGTELVCKMVGDGAPKEALAILTGSGGDVRRATLAPEGRFEALMPGWWQLVVVADGRVIEKRRLRLGRLQSHMFTVTVPLSGRMLEEGS
jgi:hypothetical protein